MANQSEISYGDSVGLGNESLFKRSTSHDQNGGMPIYGENLKKSSPKPNGRWNLVCSIGYTKTAKFVQMMALRHFAPRSNLVPYAFVWERVFRNYCSLWCQSRYMEVTKWVHEHMNIKGQGHSLTLVQGYSDSTFSNFISLETAERIEAKFHVVPPWDGILKVQIAYVTWPKWPPCPYMVKPFKNLFSGTKRPMTLIVGMRHWLLKYYQMRSNDDTGLTLTYFTRSNLVPFV